jgi:hypothetical protein
MHDLVTDCKIFILLINVKYYFSVNHITATGRSTVKVNDPRSYLHIVRMRSLCGHFSERIVTASLAQSTGMKGLETGIELFLGHNAGIGLTPALDVACSNAFEVFCLYTSDIHIVLLKLNRFND